MANQLAALRAAARGVADVNIEFADAAMAPEQLFDRCRGARAIVVGMGVRTFTPELASRLEGLHLVQTMTAGMDYLDVDGLRKIGLTVRDNGGSNAPAVAEHAIALMFAVHRKLVEQVDSVRRGTWAEGVAGGPEDFRTFVGLRVGIIGLGRIGSRVAKRLTGWECDVVFHDIASFSPEYTEAASARRIAFDELLATSDVVTLHVPLNDTTRHMIGPPQLTAMKNDGVLINTSRGSVVDEEGLIEALRGAEIAGCGLDVVATEPLDPSSPLLSLPNVVVTPHFATRSIQSGQAAAANAIANIVSALKD